VAQQSAATTAATTTATTSSAQPIYQTEAFLARVLLPKV